MSTTLDEPERGGGLGSTLAMSGSGAMLVAGTTLPDVPDSGIVEATSQGLVFAYRRQSPQTWSRVGLLRPAVSEPNDAFSSSLALSGDGLVLAVGAVGDDASSSDPRDNGSQNSGAAHLFRWTGSVWRADQFLTASQPQANDRFGSGVALSADGGTLAIGIGGQSTAVGGVNPPASGSAPRSGAVAVWASP